MGLDFARAIASIEEAEAASETLADGEPVYIRELDGDEREIELADTDLPERGFEVGGELRSQVSWYPGASSASTQVLGTSEEDVVLAGRFRDVWWGRNGWAASQTQLLRRLWLGQRYCELSWGTLLVRRGYIKRVRARYETEHDISYELVFQVSEGDEAEVVVTEAAEIDLASTFELSDLLDLLGDAMEAVNTAANISNTAQAVL